MIGGAGARGARGARGCEAADYLCEASACKGQELGGGGGKAPPVLDLQGLKTICISVFHGHPSYVERSK